MMRIDQVSFPSGERLPMLLDDDDLPIVPACEWLLSRRHFGLSTLSRNANEIKAIHGWAKKQRIDIYERIRSGRQFTEAELTSLIEHLRRPVFTARAVAKLAVSPDTANKRLSTGQRHLTWFIDEVTGAPGTPPALWEPLTEMREKLLKYFLAARQGPEGNRKFHKHLTLKQVQFLQDALDPEGLILFGRDKRGRLRNFLMVCLLVFLGLRTGELLSLRLQDVRFGAITSINVVRRALSSNDPRRRPPQVKRLGRILIIDNPRVNILLDNYIMNERQWCIDHGKGQESGFLFVSDEGEPLSADRLRQLFIDLRTRFPDDLPSHLTPHSLRYTFTDTVSGELLRQGMEEAQREKILMYLRGDSSASSQDTYINYQAQGHTALSLYQSQAASKRNAPDVLF
jgi:integrase